MTGIFSLMPLDNPGDTVALSQTFVLLIVLTLYLRNTVALDV